MTDLEKRLLAKLKKRHEALAIEQTNHLRTGIRLARKLDNLTADFDRFWRRQRGKTK